MSYVNIFEYTIVPTETFKIIRPCAGCGGRQIFASRNHFRVNANGNRLDVWLIYGCMNCGHTYNLPVYERIRPAKLSRKEYQQFLENDIAMAFKVGTDKSVFARNKAEIAGGKIKYLSIPRKKCPTCLQQGDSLIRLYNVYGLPVRVDKLAAGILNVTRSEAKRLLSEERVVVKVEQ